jgi:hypothetical protein
LIHTNTTFIRSNGVQMPVILQWGENVMHSSLNQISCKTDTCHNTLFSSRTDGWGMHQSYVLLLWMKKSWGEKARKHGTHSAAKCSIVEHQLPATANGFVKYICKQKASTHEYCVLMCEINYTKILAFVLHLKVRLHHARRKCKLAATQFSCQCFCYAASKHTELLMFISRSPLCWLVTHNKQNPTPLPILLKKL